MSDFKDTLAKILAKEPVALTEADKAFLRARASYLSAEEKKQYAEVLKEKSKQETAKDEKQKAEEKEKKKEDDKRKAEKALADKKTADEKAATEKKAADEKNK